jgi:hypothetical protein
LGEEKPALDSNLDFINDSTFSSRPVGPPNVIFIWRKVRMGAERFELSTSRTRTAQSTGLGRTPKQNSHHKKGRSLLFGKKIEMFSPKHRNVFSKLLDLF